MKPSQILRKVDFFEDISDDKLDEIFSYFKENSYSKGEIIFEENSRGEHFYLIKKGKVEVMRDLGFEGKIYETELSYLEPYTYFGEMALFDDSLRSATIKAVEDTVLLEIGKEDFVRFCIANPQVVLKLIQTISFRMRKTNDKYMKMMDSLLKKNKMAAIGNAASKIVHDIKTPITVIILTAQMLSQKSPEISKYAKRIEHQTHVLDSMIREILDFAKGKQSKLKITYYEIQKLFDDLRDDLNIIADQKGIKLKFNNNYPDKIPFDFQKIKRTVTNIIKNAMEAMKTEGLIEVGIKNFDKDNVLLYISDTGPGIPEKILKNIFDPFVTSGKDTGTGLGLAISQKVVNDHKGEISAKNKDRGGAVFEIRLPKKYKR